MTVLGGPWAWAQMKDSSPDAVKDMRLSPIPQKDPTAAASRCYAYYMAVNQHCKQQAEAWKFIGYVTSQHDRWIEDVQFVQPVKEWEKSDAAQKMDFIDAWAESYKVAKFDEVGPNWTQIGDTIARSIQDTILNGVPPEQSFVKAATAINQVIGG